MAPKKKMARSFVCSLRGSLCPEKKVRMLRRSLPSVPTVPRTTWPSEETATLRKITWMAFLHFLPSGLRLDSRLPQLFLFSFDFFASTSQTEYLFLPRLTDEAARIYSLFFYLRIFILNESDTVMAFYLYLWL